MDRRPFIVHYLDVDIVTPYGKEPIVATSSESLVREFAAEFPTPNVKRAIALCEAGTLTWAEVAEIFRSSLAKGLEAVA